VKEGAGVSDLPKMEAGSLMEETINWLIQFIAEQGLKDGDRMPTERELAERLKVGRSTVREAIRVLVSRNVLEVRRGVGAFVSYKNGIADDPLGFALVRDQRKLAADLLDFRIMIEPRIAQWAAQYATPDEVAELEYLCDSVDELILAGKPHMEKDREYHTRIARCSRNLIMPKLLPIIHGAIGLFIEETKGALRTETMKTHRAILNAIKRKDGAAASDAMTRHLIYNRDSMRIAR
jgi:DNA-binding FadR family transcriptional regulator